MESTTQKPKLVSMPVPWMVSGVPKEVISFDDATSRLTVDFIAYFLLHPIKNEIDEELYVVPKPPPFRPADDYERKPYHLVRLVFEGVESYEKFWNISDAEIIPEANYDWKHVPFSDMKPGETIQENIAASHHYWKETRFSPDPLFHQILQPHQEPDDEIGIKDYFWFGMDESLRISARSWRWELGQPVK